MSMRNVYRYYHLTVLTIFPIYPLAYKGRQNDLLKKCQLIFSG